MNNYCKKVSNLPVIPSNVILSLNEIIKNKDCFSVKNYSHVYSSYEANDELIHYLENFFDDKIIVRYQVIRQNLPVHTDKIAVPEKLNYIIDPGGTSVKTKFWSSVEEPRELVEEHVLEKNSWYLLNIQKPHSVHDLETTRTSITVKMKD